MNNGASLTRVLRDFERRADLKGLQEFISSPDYITSLIGLPPAAIKNVSKAQAAAFQACWGARPLPPRLSMRVRWTPAKIADLRRAARKHGEDFEGIARELAIPQENARRAYYRWVKGAVATAA